IGERYVARHPEDPDGADLEAVRRFAVQELREEQDHDLQALGVTFDVYFLESSLYASSKVEKTLRQLVAAGHTYEKDGAVWLKTTDFGDDKDRVMRKRAEKGGDYTYFLPDVAYHVDKWERGFSRAINVQGADHHSTVTRVRIGLQALDMGIPTGYPEYVLHQMVTVMKGGQEMRLSKRAGSYLTLRELVDEVGRDAVRYFFLMRRGDSHLVFDVDLAKSQTEDNPVVYVQMAHARMSGIFRVAAREPGRVTADGVDLGALTTREEVDLLKELAAFPGRVPRAPQPREPHRLAGAPGRSAVFFSAAGAILHNRVQVVGVVGSDYPLGALHQLEARGVDLTGVERAPGESFRWKARYSYDLASRETLETRLGVFAAF